MIIGRIVNISSFSRLFHKSVEVLNSLWHRKWPLREKIIVWCAHWIRLCRCVKKRISLSTSTAVVYIVWQGRISRFAVVFAFSFGHDTVIIRTALLTILLYGVCYRGLTFNHARLWLCGPLAPQLAVASCSTFD